MATGERSGKNAELHIRVLLIGNYEKDRQESMLRFANCLNEGLQSRGIAVELIRPEPFFGRLVRSASGLGKWLGYIDKYVIFPFLLRRKLAALSSNLRPPPFSFLLSPFRFFSSACAPRIPRRLRPLFGEPPKTTGEPPVLPEPITQRETTLVVHVVDHSNSIYTRYLQDVPHLVTCNDLLAVRSALGEFPQNRTRFSGRILQRWILSGLKRAQRITCISEATRQDVLRLTGRDPSEVTVTYMGQNYPYSPMPMDEARQVVAAMLEGEGRRKKDEGRGRMSEDGGLEAEERRMKDEGRGRSSEVGSDPVALPITDNKEPITKNVPSFHQLSTLNSQLPLSPDLSPPSDQLSAFNSPLSPDISPPPDQLSAFAFPLSPEPPPSSAAVSAFNFQLSTFPCPYLLHVGGNQWYKNRLGVLKIYCELKLLMGADTPILVMAGKAFSPQMESFLGNHPELHGCVRIVTGADNEQLRALYSAAELLLFPSLAEGFGWPIIEAQACGCRVVTSSEAPMSEVAGDGAMFLDPLPAAARDRIGFDHAGWLQAAAVKVAAVINEDADTRRKRVESDMENARRFSTDQMIDAYRSLYEEVCNAASRN